MPKTVVGRTFLGVGQDGISLGGFFESFFGVLVARVFVRVMLDRKRAIRPFYLDLGSGACNA